MNIPLIIGVTGHRNIRNEDTEILETIVKKQLQDFQMRYPQMPIVMLNSLAQGADLLCSKVALELNIPLIVPLPFSIERYRKDFSEEALMEFNRQCQLTKELFEVIGFETPVETTDDFAYRQAGLYIIRHCHILISLWDGMESDIHGCGTATFTTMAIQGGLSNNDCFTCANDTAVIHIVTPRQDKPLSNDAFSVHLIEPKQQALHDDLMSTHRFNTDSRTLDQPRYPLIYIELEGCSERLHLEYQASDQCSTYYQNRYLKAMRTLSWCGVLLVLSFLLYDEAEANLFLIIYGLLILISLGIYIQSMKDEVHIKYLEYRALAETLRVQFYLSLFGIKENITEHFTWTQKKSNGWIRKSVTALLIGSPPKQILSAEQLKTLWIDDQLAYHKKALIKKQKQLRLNNQMTQTLLIASISLFILISIIEFLFPAIADTIIPVDPIKAWVLFHQGQEIIVRGVLKIILGTVSAMTLFLSNYYGKLSLNRKISDHQKMIEQYQQVQRLFFDLKGKEESLFIALAKEEILENGSWLSYCKDNELTINI